VEHPEPVNAIGSGPGFTGQVTFGSVGDGSAVAVAPMIPTVAPISTERKTFRAFVIFIYLFLSSGTHQAWL
jgi:hypothetical protein